MKEEISQLLLQNIKEWKELHELIDRDEKILLNDDSLEREITEEHYKLKSDN